MSDVTLNAEDRALLDRALYAAKRRAMDLVVQAQTHGMPGAEAGAARDRDRLGAMLEAVRDPRGGVFILPQQDAPAEAG